MNEEIESVEMSSLLESEVKIYFNEFGVGISPNDVFIVVRRNGTNEAILNSSHVTAKTFANALIRAIEGFEKKTNQTILESHKIEELMKENEDHNNEN